MIETVLVNLLVSATSLPVRPFSDTNLAVKPCLTYWRPNTNRPLSNDGATGQAIVDFQIDCWANDIATSQSTLDTVRKALNGLTGVYSSTQIDMIRVLDQQDQISIPVRPGTQKPPQRSTMIVRISYTEDVVAIVPPCTPRGAFDSAFN